MKRTVDACKKYDSTYHHFHEQKNVLESLNKRSEDQRKATVEIFLLLAYTEVEIKLSISCIRNYLFHYTYPVETMIASVRISFPLHNYRFSSCVHTKKLSSRNDKTYTIAWFHGYDKTFTIAWFHGDPHMHGNLQDK
jgi:hypothetical protein